MPFFAPCRFPLKRVIIFQVYVKSQKFGKKGSAMMKNAIAYPRNHAERDIFFSVFLLRENYALVISRRDSSVNIYFGLRRFI